MLVKSSPQEKNEQGSSMEISSFLGARSDPKSGGKRGQRVVNFDTEIRVLVATENISGITSDRTGGRA